MHKVFAGCCQPLLGVGPSRRCLCESFPTCLDPYPGGFCAAHTRFFTQNNGLRRGSTGSAPYKIPTQQFQCGTSLRGCSHSLMFRPVGLLATPIAPTAADHDPGLPQGSVGFGGNSIAFALALSPTPLALSSFRQPTGQPWLLLPRQSRFVTSPSRGYANRPFRVTDGKGTFTLPDSQPCRLLRFQDVNTVAVCSIAFNEAVIASGWCGHPSGL